MVDPLDGTSDFLKGRRGSALSIALIRDGVPVWGVVASPVAPDDGGDVIAWAEGARLTRNGKPVQQRPQRQVPLVGLNAQAGEYADHNMKMLGDMRIVFDALACISADSGCRRKF